MIIDSVGFIEIVISLLGGTALALVYFGLLWLTIEQLPTRKYPFRLLVISLMLRMSLLLLAMHLILSDTHWIRLILVLTGFTVARFILLNKVNSFSQTPDKGVLI